MKSIIRAAALAAGCASLSACATVVRGTHTNWEVKTSPPGASVRTSNGRSCAATPCTLRMYRKADFTATISKPGYKPVDVKVTHAMSAGGVTTAVVGNAVIGGVPGLVVDLTVGGAYDLKPRKADLALQKDEAYQAVARYSTPSDPAPPVRQDSFSQYSAPSDPSPVRQDTFSLQRHANESAQPDRQGRVIAIQVLPDGSVVETRGPYN